MINKFDLIKYRAEALEGIKKWDKQTGNSKAIEDITNGLIGNTAVTIFDFYKQEFIYHWNIEKLFGYENEIFTHANLNNLSKPFLTHPHDIGHKLRYDKIVYEIIAQKKPSFLDDCYQLTFRLKHQNGDEVTVRRKCYLLCEKEDPIPKQLDLWEQIIRTDSDFFVEPILISKNTDNHTLFYNGNEKHLNIFFTEMEKKVLHFKIHNMADKLIADKLNIAIKTVQKHLENIRTKIRNYIENEKQNYFMDEVILNSCYSDLSYFLKHFGLYPFPEK